MGGSICWWGVGKAGWCPGWREMSTWWLEGAGSLESERKSRVLCRCECECGCGGEDLLGCAQVGFIYGARTKSCVRGFGE
jgi:hypothetical protein